MSYPFKNIALNRNRKIIAVANPSADITQMVAKAVPGVADNYRGVWDTSGTYTNGEMVLYSNVVWLCLASETTAPPATGSTVWQAIGSYSAFLGAWSSSTTYVVGDEVTYGGNFYFCTAANTNQTPSTSSSYWQIAGPSNLDNVPDGPTYTKTLGSVQTGNIPDLGKGILGKHLGNIVDDPAGNYLRWTGGQQKGFLTNHSPNHILDPAFQTVGAAAGSFWSGGTASNGVLNLGTVAASGFADCFQYDGRGNVVLIPCQPGDTIVLQLTWTQLATGTANTYLAIQFANSSQALQSSYGGVYSAVLGTFSNAITVPAGMYYFRCYLETGGGASGGNSALVTNPQVRLNHETVADANARKSYADFTDNTPGGHVGKVLTNIADDATYTKTLASVQTGNVPDLSKGILGKSLANIADDSGSSRYAVLAVDTNRRAVIDFTQSAHVGKTQSNIADDSNAKMLRFGTLASRPAAGTAGRIYHASDAGTNGITYRDTGAAWEQMAVGHLADISGTTDNLAAGATTNVVNQTNLTGGNVDLGKSGVANRILDNMADTGNYIKTVQQSGNANSVDVPNALFQINTGSVFPGWNVIEGLPIVAAGTTGPNPEYGTQYLQLQSTEIANIVLDSQLFKCKPNDVVTVGGALYSNNGDTVAIYVVFFDGTGSGIHQDGISTTAAAWSTSQTSNQTAPANSVGFKLRLYFNATAVNHYAMFNEVWCSLNDVRQPNSSKAYADFSDNTSGGHIGKTQSNVADDANAKMLRFGTLAGRPAAGTAGRIYHASDAGTNGITYRDTGSAWIGMAVGHLADIGGTLDNTNDGSSRFAVAAVDPNKKALIDFSQPGHSNANIQYFGGIQSGTCYDGQAITFSPAYASVPLVIFSGGGMSYSSVTGSATTQSQAFTASSLTTSGFTASLKLVSGGTLTARTDTFTTVTSGSEYQATLTNAPAYNNTYTVNWVLSLGSASGGTVYIRETNSSGTILFQKNYINGQNGAKSTNVTWSGATGTSVIDISLVLTEGTGTISASNVTFTSGTAPSSVSAVPSTAPITWIAFPQT